LLDFESTIKSDLDIVLQSIHVSFMQLTKDHFIENIMIASMEAY